VGGEGVGCVTGKEDREGETGAEGRTSEAGVRGLVATLAVVIEG